MPPTRRPPKDTPKSQRTRERILDAAMALFAELGYHRAANGSIAQAAGITRTAMHYHFPTRTALVGAAIPHIEAARTQLFENAAAHPPQVDAAEHAIDAYWTLLHEAPFRAFAELEAAARTDPDLAAQLQEAQSAFDHAQVGASFNALAQAGEEPRFQTSRDLGRFLLEGLAKGAMTYDEPARRSRLLAAVKRAVHALNRKGDVQDLWAD